MISKFDLLTSATAFPELLDEQEHDISWFLVALTAPDYNGLADLTYIETAGCNPFRDEGEACGRLLGE